MNQEGLEIQAGRLTLSRFGFFVVISDLRCLGDFLALVLADSALHFQYQECQQGSRLTDFAGLEGPSKQTCTGFSWTIQILLFFNLLVFKMCVSVLPASLCTTCVPYAHRSQKKISDPLGLELWEL